MVLSWRWHWICCRRHSQGLLPLSFSIVLLSLWDTPLAQYREGLNSLLSSGLGWGDRAGRGEGRWIWPHTQPYNPFLWRQQPCAGVALWWARTETAESWQGKDRKQHISQSGVPEEGAHASRDPVPGLCMHLDQLQSHLSCLEESLPVLGLTHTHHSTGHISTLTAPRGPCGNHMVHLRCFSSWENHHPTYYSQRQGVQHPNLQSAAPGAIPGMDNSSVHQHRSERNRAPV